MNSAYCSFALIVAFAFTTAGCVTKHQTMPALDIPCAVYDVATDKPLPNAEILVTYRGANGDTVTRGPFLTDNTGKTKIAVPQEVISVPGMDAYFAGGYLRAVTASAPGYDSRTFDEGFTEGLIEEAAPLVFKLHKPGAPFDKPTDDSVSAVYGLKEKRRNNRS